MFSSDDVIQRLKKLQAAENRLKLINTYKGIPISYEASMVSLEGNTITFRMNKYQVVCLELQRQTFLQSDMLPETVRGSAISVDISKETAVLGAFVPMGPEIGRRLLVRVEPREPLQAEVLIKGSHLRAQVVDISVDGIGVQTSATFYGLSFFGVTTPVLLTLQFPGNQAPVKLHGTIMNVVKGRNAYRLGIRTSPDAGARQSISQFVTQRQGEIMRELRMMYEMFMKMKNAGS